MGDRVVVAIVGVTAVMTGVITEEGRPRGGCDVVVIDDDDDVEKTTRRLTTGKKRTRNYSIHGIDADVDRSTAPAAAPRDRIISL